MAWDPQQYLKFGDNRFRPGLELLNRVSIAAGDDAVELIYDLGCGTGSNFGLLAPFGRFVGTEVEGTLWADARPRPARPVLLARGESLPFPDECFGICTFFDVLEHIEAEDAFLQEIGRVLKQGGKAVFLIPQTSTTHLAPHYHQNLSRYWIARALPRAGLEVVEHHALGGVWSTMASRLVYFFLQAIRFEGMSDAAIKRGPLFYLLFPFMALYALVSIPICLILALGDLAEEPNNHLVVARRAANAGAGHP